MNFLTRSIIIVVGLTVLASILSATYSTMIRPFVRLWFGDEPGQCWNKEARQRRQRFEKTCGSALSCMLLSILTGTARILISELSAELGRLLLIAQLGLISVMILFIWAAISQWREPFEN